MRDSSVDDAATKMTLNEPDPGSTSGQVLNTLYINAGVFVFLLLFFEFNRHMRSIYLKRLTPKFESTKRVPPRPPTHLFGWLAALRRVTEEDLLRMVGLDAYMLIRYINVCLKISAFLMFWSCVLLIPIYVTSKGGQVEWNKYTIANIPDDPSAYQLWVPTLLIYFYSAFFCHLMYSEYKNFVQKRIQYLILGDPDTPIQTYYTVIVEKLPQALRSEAMLRAFFEKLFPDQVYAVELAYDLNELDQLILQRRSVRDRLEKSVALWKATGIRPTIQVSSEFYSGAPHPLEPLPSKHSFFLRLLGVELYDAIDHYYRVLRMLNDNVADLQAMYFDQMRKHDAIREEMEQKYANEMAATMAMSVISQSMSLHHITSHSPKQMKGGYQPLRQYPDATSTSASYITDSYNHHGSGGVGGDDGINGTDRSYLATPSANNNRPAVHPLSPIIESPEPVSLSSRSSNESLADSFIINNSNHNHHQGLEKGIELLGVGLNSTEINASTPVSSNTSSMHERRQVPSASMGDGGGWGMGMGAAPGNVNVAGGSALQSESKDSESDSVHSLQDLRVNANGVVGITHHQHDGSARKRIEKAMDLGAKLVKSANREGMKIAKFSAKGALKGIMEVSRSLEMLTVGAYYKTSTTAFVTLKSRVATCSSHQMLLSHGHFNITVKAAPNPMDIIWDNISLPRRQISTRRSIADGTLIVGAIFWSFVVGFIASISNLEIISKETGWVWIQYYNKTQLYVFLNNYLALGLLLVLLATLPYIFDMIARDYEGLKLESEIQNSIMNRYFYYQLANVFVSVGLGSLASSLQKIINSPSSIFSILGSSVPSFSTYFAKLLIVKTFTAVPIEMLRVWPLLEMLMVQFCVDKKKCTRRELRTGAFADPPMLYGWIYPNLIMVLMIMLTYCCIAPLVVPFALLFYSFSYCMYKYQLLYVYINVYQSGGFMWYAVFKHSMVGLICGVVTLLCYMGIRDAFFSGPFYLMVPLPFCIGLFWRYCESKFKEPSLCLSLDSAIDIDRLVATRKLARRQVPHSSFSTTLFRQPSLSEGPLKPALYRVPARSEKPLPAQTKNSQREKGKGSWSGGGRPIKEHDLSLHQQKQHQQQQQQQQQQQYYHLHHHMGGQTNRSRSTIYSGSSASVGTNNSETMSLDSPTSSTSSLQTLGSLKERDENHLPPPPLSPTRVLISGAASGTASAMDSRSRFNHRLNHSLNDDIDDMEYDEEDAIHGYEEEDPEIGLDIHVNEILNSPTPFNRLSTTILSPFRSGTSSQSPAPVPAPTSATKSANNTGAAVTTLYSPLAGAGGGAIQGQTSYGSTNNGEH